MKKIFFVFSILALAACERKTLDNSPKTIMIKSTGEVETVPDQASFQIYVHCLENTVKASKSCLVSKSNDLIAKLEAMGIAKNDILTTSVDLNKSFTWQNNSNVFEGYRATTTINVTIKNIDSLDEIYTELLENRNLELAGLAYNHSKIDSLQNEAYVRALKKSETLADKLLEKLPEGKKEVLRIGNVEIASSTPKRGRMADASNEQASLQADQSSIGMNSGTVRIAATLYVEYQIE